MRRRSGSMRRETTHTREDTVSNPSKGHASNKSVESVAGALETYVRAVLEDGMSEMRSSLAALETKITGQVDNLQRQTKSELEKIRSDLQAGLHQQNQNLQQEKKVQHKELDELKARLTESVAATKENTQKTHDQTMRSLSDMRSDIEKSVQAVGKTLDAEINQIKQSLSTHDSELRLRKDETKRVSSLLANFARVFSGNETDSGESASEEPPAAPRKEQSKQHSGASPAPADAHQSSHVYHPGSSSSKQQPSASQPKKSEKQDAHDDEKSENSEHELPSSNDIEDTIDGMFRLGK